MITIQASLDHKGSLCEDILSRVVCICIHTWHQEGNIQKSKMTATLYHDSDIVMYHCDFDLTSHAISVLLLNPYMRCGAYMYVLRLHSTESVEGMHPNTLCSSVLEEK